MMPSVRTRRMRLLSASAKKRLPSESKRKPRGPLILSGRTTVPSEASRAGTRHRHDRFSVVAEPPDTVQTVGPMQSPVSVEADALHSRPDQLLGYYGADASVSGDLSYRASRADIQFPRTKSEG